MIKIILIKNFSNNDGNQSDNSHDDMKMIMKTITFASI